MIYFKKLENLKTKQRTINKTIYVVLFRFRFDPRANESFNFGFVIGVSSVATLVCATFIILQPSSVYISCNLNKNKDFLWMIFTRNISFYFDNDIEPPSDKRRLSISTVNRQIYKDKMQIWAVNFNRRRGGTVLKKTRKELSTCIIKSNRIILFKSYRKFCHHFLMSRDHQY